MTTSESDVAEKILSAAREIAHKDELPDVLVTEAFIRSAGHHAALNIVASEKEGGSTPRADLAEAMTLMFEQALLMYLKLYSSDENGGKEVPESHSAPNEGSSIPDALDCIGGSAEHPDVALVGYLRGRGQHALAQTLVLRFSERRLPDADVAYAKRVHAAMERGELYPPLAVAVIGPLLQGRMQREVSGKPVFVDEAVRTRWAQFYAHHGLHKLSTMVRKNYANFVEMEREGGRELYGQMFEELSKGSRP
ncbi:hypothetical protein [Methylibium petroleiphilum]|nr:hypothetical protein [Methylibium petroleiphilum]